MKSNLLSVQERQQKILKKTDLSSAAQTVSPNIIKHQIIQAEEKGSEIIKDAKELAEKLVADAKDKAEAIRSSAYKGGREAAESDLLEDLLAIKDARLKVFNTIEKDMLRLSVKIAEKIIGAEVGDNKSIRGEIVLNALRSARQKEMLTVRINAKDLPIVEELKPQLAKSNYDQTIDFVPDQAVSEGGCIIESSAGTIDARLETQLRLLEAALINKITGEN